MDLSELSIVPAHEVEERALQDFYRSQYPGRALPSIWRWLNRSAFSGQRTPLAVLYRTRVIAHAGAMPFWAMFKGTTYTASWYIDFAVMPEFQRQGVGMALTKRWMDYADFHVAFANERSIGVLKKHGWIESRDTYLQCYLLRPLHHPKFSGIPGLVRTTGTVITDPLLRLRYRAFGMPQSHLRLDPVDGASLEAFLVPRDPPVDDSRVVPVRDAEYASWRLLDSPNRAHYRVASLDGMAGAHMVINLRRTDPSASVDVLWTTPAAEPVVIRAMLATLAHWGIRQGYAYLRFYTSSQALSRYLSRALTPVVRHPRFAYYSRDAELFSALQQARWEWELIDCDFETF